MALRNPDNVLRDNGLTAPQSVSLDAADNLYVTDSGNVYEVNRRRRQELMYYERALVRPAAQLRQLRFRTMETRH